MASIKKYQTGIVPIMKHNIREFKSGKCSTNEEVDLSRTKDNYSLVSRGNTAKEIEQYRKSVMTEVFHYNRKNIVLANEVLITLPKDCPPEQERKFFEESLKYVESTLPMGRRCILQAEVHKDEGTITKDGEVVAQGAPHLHILYIPAVNIDERTKSKNPDFEYKLCSDQLTKRSVLKEWHPRFQKWLNEANVQATVHSGTTNGKNVSIRVLKEMTKQTGMTLEQIKSLEKENNRLQEKLLEKDKQLEVALNKITELERNPSHQHTWGTQGWGTIDKTEGERLW